MAAWQEALALARPDGARPGAGALSNLFRLASLLGGERLERQKRLKGRQQARMNVSCSQPTGNGCRLAPGADATSHRGGHGEPRGAAGHLVPEVQS